MLVLSADLTPALSPLPAETAGGLLPAAKLRCAGGAHWTLLGARELSGSGWRAGGSSLSPAVEQDPAGHHAAHRRPLLRPDHALGARAGRHQAPGGAGGEPVRGGSRLRSGRVIGSSAS